MNYRMILWLLGWLLLIEAAFLLLPLLVAVCYGEQSGLWFLVTLAAAGALGFVITRFKPKKRAMYAREGFVITALGWIILSVVGSMPFWISGQIPHYVDALFETVSGFTTTGSTILTDVEALDRCMNLWRCLTHWLGGMGILVFMLAVVNLGGGQSNHLLRAESPGPTVSKMLPNMRKSSAMLYGIYIALTLILMLFLLAGGMPLYDTICTAFGTAGTGGFGIRGDSLGGYSTYIQSVVAVFMLLFGVNFNVYYFLIMRKFATAFRNTEVWVYLGIIAVSTVTIGINILHLMPGWQDALHHAFFTVCSLITTAGYATVNFELWPEFSRIVFVLLILVGACAGSTGGGFKVARVVILAKAAASEIRRLLHPRSVKVLTMDGKQISQETVRGVMGYSVIYVAVIIVSLLLVSLDNFDTTTTLTAVLTTVNNVGPGLNLVGPMGSFAIFSDLSKIVMTLTMLFGRLELFPMLILLMPSTWRKH